MDIMWIWCGLGLILLCLEMMTGTMYLLWPGMAALAMALLAWLLPAFSTPWQIVIYAIFSVLAVAIWRKREKTHPTPRVGQAQGEEIGREGVIIHAVTPAQSGLIRFSQGVMGSKEWSAVADVEIAANQPARIVAVEGNSVRVVPI
ncbi:MAG: NfeD family protein [Methylophilus sp.]|uniref:NfeD family protein n=1 Tax=Methylophilus sp. TaxID=29541 RepID=UPI002B553B0B|nr:NfeD family protein [Methylophilus sp.]HSH87495.1 NfeD family protein [Methylophilus sp.]